MLPGQLENIVIKCFSCGTLNEITSTRERPGSTRPDSKLRHYPDLPLVVIDTQLSLS